MKTNDIWDKNWSKNFVPEVHSELISIIDHYSPGKKILEIGFGSGGDLTELSKLGYECWGLEKSKVSYNLSKKQKKFRSIFGDGEHTKFKKEEFDLIFHQGVLEHFKNPNIFLSETARILKRNGIIVIDVPHKWNLFTIYKKIYQIFDKWYGGWERSYDEYELKDLVKRFGFATLKISYRGVWPHQWGKFLFPGRIIENGIAKKILTRTPFKYIQRLIKRFYIKNRWLRIVSSYNIIIVAKKK